MHIRCPHCHNAIEIVEDSSFRDVSCPSCGSHFNLVGGDAPTASGPAKPRRIGHFELIEQLGVGNFGTVWKAKDTALDRFVAVKIPRSDQLDEADVEKFFREARAAAQLRHPNIVAVHEVGRDGNTIFIASDYVEGATLKEWMGGQPLAPREAAKLCAKIADALHSAHEAGVVHRDLKPGNVMMDMNDEPHIMDFGLAKRESGEITMTIDGALLGTPAYMSPEQAAGKGHEADRRADVYSLGVILFEMLTGELPFRGEKRMLLVQIQRDEPPSPRKLNGNVPRDLETICLKCLEKPQEKRYQSASELSDELKRFLAGQAILARRIGRIARGWRWAKRNPTVASLAIAVAGLLLGGLVATSYWATIAAQKSRQAVESLVSSLGSAHPSTVHRAIEAIRPFRDDALPILTREYETGDALAKLHVAYGLADCGQIESRFLLGEIANEPAGECGNIASALALDRESALKDIEIEAVKARHKQEWKVRTRLATVGLYLSDISLAAEMLQGEPMSVEPQPWDPIQRTMFIEHFPAWPGPVEKLVELLRACDDNSLRSGMCLAIGSVRDLAHNERKAWQELLTEWYVDALDGGTHSAAAWALRSWGVTLPEIPKHRTNRSGFNWLLTTTGITMIQIPPGTVEAPLVQTATNAAYDHKHEIMRRIEIPRAFWLSDQEVTVGQFLQFLGDKNAERPKVAESIISLNAGDPSRPVGFIDFPSHYMFCNWLSQKEGRGVYYRKERKTRKDDVGNTTKEYEEWTSVPGCGGYRLPTEDEWEYACRARTTTAFSFGDSEALLDRYAVFLRNSNRGPDITGGKLCNAWGLFDMHGNLWEQCKRSHANSSLGRLRGGGWSDAAAYCRSGNLCGSPESGVANRGFRLALDVAEKAAPPKDAK